jgi:hypothetical protein
MGGSAVRTTTVAALVVLLAACSAEPPMPSGGVPHAGLPPVPDPAEAAATREVLAAYRGFREAEVSLNAHPVAPDVATATLSRHVVEPLLSRLNWNVYNLYVNDLARGGRSTSEPELVDLRLDARPPWATIRDCLDTTGWPVVDRDTGQPSSGKDVAGLYAVESGRHTRVITVVRYEDGWRLEDATWQLDTSC